MTFKTKTLLLMVGLTIAAGSVYAGRPVSCAQVSAGGFHTLALMDDGTVQSWGANGRGQLGIGPLEDQFLGGPGHWEHRVMETRRPMNVKGVDGETDFSGIKAVAAGYRYSAALAEDGGVWTWGLNERGQLGLGLTGEITLPAPVKAVGGAGALSWITAITAGYNHMAALHADGTVYAWGCNAFGQLGDGTREDRFTPVRVQGPDGADLLTGITAIAAGYHFTVALREDGTVWAWGIAETVRPGADGIAWNGVPVQVKGIGGQGVLSNIKALSAGHHHILALRNDGMLLAWGGNGHGQLGAGTTEDSTAPVQVKGIRGQDDVLSDITTMAAGSRHSVALMEDGTVLAWGCNLHGQLGVEGLENEFTAVPTKISAGMGFMEGKTAALSAGHHHTAALHANGALWIWGSGRDGQLGNMTTTGSPTPSHIGTMPPPPTVKHGEGKWSLWTSGGTRSPGRMTAVDVNGTRASALRHYISAPPSSDDLEGLNHRQRRAAMVRAEEATVLDFTPVKNGYLTISFDARVSSTASRTIDITLFPAGAVGNEAWFLVWGRAPGKLHGRQGGDFTAIDENWHRYDIVNNLDERTFQVWIDGKLASEELGFRYGTNRLPQGTPFGRLRFGTTHGTSHITGNADVNNGEYADIANLRIAATAEAPEMP